MSAVARESLSSQASFSALVPALIIETMASALSTPQKETAATSEFSAKTSTQSPRFTPRRASALASALEAASSSA